MNRNPRTVVIVYSPTPRYASMTAALTATLGPLAAGITKMEQYKEAAQEQSCAIGTFSSGSSTAS